MSANFEIYTIEKIVSKFQSLSKFYCKTQHNCQYLCNLNWKQKVNLYFIEAFNDYKDIFQQSYIYSILMKL